MRLKSAEFVEALQQELAANIMLEGQGFGNLRNFEIWPVRSEFATVLHVQAISGRISIKPLYFDDIQEAGWPVPQNGS